ncbi:MAG: hypothetical protein JJ939_01360 [Alphaproteobacteria bacterium]|jgi:hypothetical protein|nr:hypothetical protein [Rhodobiaceae bacterium]MBO6543023.1 hypothetical protein [Alphaproteobacteria bacterium]MBO6627050.1 hypothetical protein [Alphaproteobacteria bacterium]MDF1626457.1 hypothetical protein [Parvibaculaceae bacterium]
MDQYHFGADLLDAYRGTADWVKAVGIVTMAAFVLGFCTLIFKFQLALYEATQRHARRSRPDAEFRERFARVLGERQLDCRNKSGNDG